MNGCVPGDTADVANSIMGAQAAELSADRGADYV